jgi:hypothetical protein
MSAELVPVDEPQARLEELEVVIGRGAQTFVEVGNALFEIRESRLYRYRGFARFEDYCQERWDMSHSSAGRVIRSAMVAEVVSPNGLTNLKEAQARELAPLLKKPLTLAEVWDDAVEEAAGNPSAKLIREKVRNVLSKAADAPPAESNGRTATIRKPIAVRATEIAALAVDGASTPQIARQIGLGEQRVRDIIAECGLVVPGDEVTHKTRRLDPNHVMERTVTEISESVDTTIGLLQGRWSDLDPEKIEQWRDSLEAAIRSVNRLIKELMP